MFFYVSLFIACVVTTVLVLYLYNALAEAGKAVYRNFLPSKKDNLTSHIRDVSYNSTINDTPTPWGWKGNNGEIREHGRKNAAVNGASGLNAYLDNNNQNKSSSVGWPYREEKTEFAGKAYKVTRKSSSQKSRMRTTANQPWGW